MTTQPDALSSLLTQFGLSASWLNRVSSTPSSVVADYLRTQPELLERLSSLLLATRFRSSSALDGYIQREPRFPSATQRAFLCSDDTEHVLFGGAAGGGKSSALLGAALQFTDVPGYAALLFRKTFADLDQPDALIPRSHEWLQNESGASWNGMKRQWTFRSGAMLKFGHLDHANSELKYQGAAAQFWGFDEAGQLEPKRLQYLTTRARRLIDSDVPIRFRYSANPGGHAHQWLAEHFLMPHKRSAVWKFIPSKAADNPGLDVADYVARLQTLEDAVLLAQMLEGDWTAVDRSGMVCPEFTREVQAVVVEERARPEFFQPYASLDPGSTDLFFGLFGYLDFEAGVLVVEDELVLTDPTTEEAGTGIVAKERALWAGALATKNAHPPRRRSDHDRRLIKDLEQTPYRLLYLPAEKMDADSDRRACRTAIKRGKIRIHPRCTRLIATLANAKRLPNGDYERTEQLGHADGWDALRYLRRHVNWEENPFPAAPPHLEYRSRHAPLAPTARPSSSAQALASVFSTQRRK